MKTQLTKTEKKEFEYLIKVLSSCVNSTQPPEPYEEINWEHLINYSKICGVESIFSNMVLKLEKDKLPPKPIVDRLFRCKNKELLIDGNLHYEIEKVIQEFEKLKIKNVPLKGYFMKLEYAQPDFRSVCDFDILFDIKDLEKLKTAFNNLGYSFDHNTDSQCHFKKPPFMYIEMHASLVHDYESYYPYLKDQLSRCKKRSGYEYSCEMSVEDYYLYMLIHNSNHLRLGGMGIRMVLDTYVYYKNHKDEFDYEYLNDRLKVYGLEKYEKKVRELAFNWFSESEPKMKFDDFENYILLSQTIGRLDVGVLLHTENYIDNKKGLKKSRLSYLLSTIFPSKDNIRYNYQYLDKYPFLLPVAWISIWWKRFFIEKNVNVKRGIKNRLCYNEDEVQYLKNIFKEVGF